MLVPQQPWVFLLNMIILGWRLGKTHHSRKHPYDETPIGSSATKHIAMVISPCGTHCSGSGATKNKAWEMHDAQNHQPSSLAHSQLCLGKSLSCFATNGLFGAYDVQGKWATEVDVKIWWFVYAVYLLGELFVCFLSSSDWHLMNDPGNIWKYG